MHLTRTLNFVSKKKRFLDSLRLYLKGGAGGMGLPRYGGIGGAGGDVYVLGKEGYSLKNILKMYPTKRISAGNGENSHRNRIFGHKGTDVVIEAPLGLVLYNQTGEKLCELNQEGDKYKVISGGPGGCVDSGYTGFKGESEVITFDLKLIADVGFVGFPNAGKSTLLSRLSNAKPKIASYPFTTIQPQLGIIEYDDLRSISVADLPGLIEGAHENFGMGHKFLKHIERTKLLLVIVDVNGFQLSPKYPRRTCLQTILLLNRELELYRQELLHYPAMLIVNKMDQEGSDSIYLEVCEAVKNLKDAFYLIPENSRPDQPMEFQKVTAISALNGDDKEINRVKEYIREILDLNENAVDDEVAIIKYFDRMAKAKTPDIV